MLPGEEPFEYQTPELDMKIACAEKRNLQPGAVLQSGNTKFVLPDLGDALTGDVVSFEVSLSNWTENRDESESKFTDDENV
jgi:hypothetical protein